MRGGVGPGAAEADLLAAEEDEADGALDAARRQPGQHARRLQADDRAGAVVERALRDVMAVVVGAGEDQLVGALGADELADDVVGGVVEEAPAGLDAQARGPVAPPRQPQDRRAGLPGDADADDRRRLAARRADAAGDVQQAGVLVDEDEGDRAGVDRAAQLVGAVAQPGGRRAADRVGLGGADDDLAADGVAEALEILLLAVADVDQLGLDLAGRAVGQRDAGEGFLNRRGHPEGRRAALPGAERDRLQALVRQPVGDELVAEELAGAVLARAAGPAVADVVAEVEQVAIGLVAGPDVADELPLQVGPRRGGASHAGCPPLDPSVDRATARRRGGGRCRGPALAGRRAF